MLTPEDLIAALGLPVATPADQAWAENVVAGVNAYVDRLRHVTPGAWDGQTFAGATLLAVDIYGSRSAPAGAPGIDVTGGMVAGHIRGQVGRLLRVGASYAAPAAG